MEEISKIKEQLQAEQKKRLNEKLERFNELAKELELSEEELKLYPTGSIEELDASITNLRILKGRINQMKTLTGNEKYKGNPSKPFFGLAPPPKQEGEEERKNEKLDFNSIQIFDRMRAPSRQNEKYSSDCEIVRLYSNPFDKTGRKM